MAEVLEAEAVGDNGFVRRVALKRMLRAGLEDPAFPRMFLDEARIASQLHHSNIVSVLDFGVVDGAPFQVLELVDGADCHRLLRFSPDHRLPLEVALYIVAQIGHALTAAHEATGPDGQPLGIVHRDVSPGNILVSWSGDVKLADFGIAFAKERAERTEAGMTKGTLVYMSPEQALTGMVDLRSDIFSLGCVLHTLVTGASPLAGDGLTRLLREERLTLAEDIPPDIRSILVTATRFAPEARFASAGAMTDAVGAALAARLPHEPRRRLVAFLAEMRPRFVEPKPPGRLDVLLQLASPTAPTEGGLPMFTSSVGGDWSTLVDPNVAPWNPGSGAPEGRALDAPRGAPIPGDARLVQTVPLLARVPARPRRRVRPIAGLLGLVVAAGAVVGWKVNATRRPTASATETPRSSAPDGAAPAPLASSSSSAATSAVVVSSLATAPSTDPAVRPAHAASVGAGRTRSKPSASPERRESCSGTLFLSCPRSPRASVAVDGVSTGLHHGDFVDLSCAAHSVAFSDPGGQRVTVPARPTSANTRTSPVEVRCGLP